jgi:Ca2+/Na+ antiporter
MKSLIILQASQPDNLSITVVNFLFITLISGVVYYLNQINGVKKGVKVTNLTLIFYVISFSISTIIVIWDDNYYPNFLLAVLIFFVIYFLYVRAYTKSNMKENENCKQISNISLDMPDTCPHCKNPNSKKTRTCEWCGNQII